MKCKRCKRTKLNDSFTQCRCGSWEFEFQPYDYKPTRCAKCNSDNLTIVYSGKKRITCRDCGEVNES